MNKRGVLRDRVTTESLVYCLDIASYFRAATVRERKLTAGGRTAPSGSWLCSASVRVPTRHYTRCQRGKGRAMQDGPGQPFDVPVRASAMS
jgi:hypothetical protein